MARLNATEDVDGVKRANVRVQFRVSRRMLVDAVLWHLETRYGELARTTVCTKVIANLTRATVLGALHRALEVRGADFFEIAGENVAKGTLLPAGTRVATLFPEFD